MTWPGGLENLALWVGEPAGGSIGNPFSTIGTSGQLAPDSELGPEVYIADCNPDTLEGEYRFFDSNQNTGSNFSNPFEISVDVSGVQLYHAVETTQPNTLKNHLAIIVQKDADDPEKFRLTTFGF